MVIKKSPSQEVYLDFPVPPLFELIETGRLITFIYFSHIIKLYTIMFNCDCHNFILTSLIITIKLPRYFKTIFFFKYLIYKLSQIPKAQPT